MSKAGEGFVVVVSIFAFFCLMSRIDFIVNATLYEYGLQFSYLWANDYWVVYSFSFVVFSVVMGLMYWLGSAKTRRDRRISLGLFITVNVLMLGGLQDLLFFVLWGNGLPSDGVVWWWSPLSRVFGTWNTSMQVALTGLAFVVTLPLWAYVLRKPDVSILREHAALSVPTKN